MFSGSPVLTNLLLLWVCTHLAHMHAHTHAHIHTHTHTHTHIHPGFSFGGTLACSIAAGVWDTPYIRTDVLKMSLVCITFGQPHITMPTIARVTSDQPDMVSVIHTIRLQDDVVPRLLSVLNECCSELGPKEERTGIILSTSHMAKQVCHF